MKPVGRPRKPENQKIKRVTIGMNPEAYAIYSLWIKNKMNAHAQVCNAMIRHEAWLSS